MLSLELCRCPSDMFLSSRPRTVPDWQPRSILLVMIEARSVNFENTNNLRDSSQFSRRRPFMYLNSCTPSGQSRVNRVAQLRADGVHCRESAGTGPVNLKVLVLDECCLGRSPWTN